MFHEAEVSSKQGQVLCLKIRLLNYDVLLDIRFFWQLKSDKFSSNYLFSFQ